MLILSLCVHTVGHTIPHSFYTSAAIHTYRNCNLNLGWLYLAFSYVCFASMQNNVFTRRVQKWVRNAKTANEIDSMYKYINHHKAIKLNEMLSSLFWTWIIAATTTTSKKLWFFSLFLEIAILNSYFYFVVWTEAVVSSVFHWMALFFFLVAFLYAKFTVYHNFF